jgi:hypothetical protein
MKRKIFITILLSALASLRPYAVLAQTPPIPDIIITELQTSNKTANQEFIELYNTTDYDIDFADIAHQGKNVWKLQFFSSTKVIVNNFAWDPKTSGLTTVSLTRIDGTPVVIAAHSYFLISSAGYSPGDVEPDFTYSSGHMSDIGGGLQLVSASGTSTSQIITPKDHLGWFKPTTTQMLPSGFYITPAAQGSLQRTAVEDTYVTDSNQLTAFVNEEVISPKEAWVFPVEEPELQVVNEPDVGIAELVVVSAEEPAETTQMLPIYITELLPNPSSPQSDDKDEYIELFNPNDEIINLSGYSLQAGLKFSYNYTFQEATINPLSYLYLTSGNTSLSLANSAGQARLLDASGQVLSQTDAYDSAPEGQAWALKGESWQWTTVPTAGTENVISAPSIRTIAQPKLALPKKAVPKATSSKKVIPPKSKATSVKAAKTAKAAPAPKPSATLGKVPPAALHKSILVGVGTLAVVYGLYEYRTDMANKLYQFRRNRTARRENRQAPQG